MNKLNTYEFKETLLNKLNSKLLLMKTEIEELESLIANKFELLSQNRTLALRVKDLKNLINRVKDVEEMKIEVEQCLNVEKYHFPEHCKKDLTLDELQEIFEILKY